LWGAYRVPYSHVPKWKGRKFKNNYHYTILAERLCVWAIRIGERELIWWLSPVSITLWRLCTNWVVILDIHINGDQIQYIRLWQSGTGILHSFTVGGVRTWYWQQKQLCGTVKSSVNLGWNVHDLDHASITMFNWGCDKVWHFWDSECFLFFVSRRLLISFVEK
jgi:hypothetical protein